MLSNDLGSASLLAGDDNVDERVHAFLLDLAVRHAMRGFSGTRRRLGMSRADIANYLRLAAETVSRVLGRFGAQTLMVIEGREPHLRDPGVLRKIGDAQLPDCCGSRACAGCGLRRITCTVRPERSAAQSERRRIGVIAGQLGCRLRGGSPSAIESVIYCAMGASLGQRMQRRD